MRNLRIRSGDTVRIISGKDVGKTGVVERTFPVQHRLVVTGVNVVKKSVRSSRKHPRGGFIELPFPMHISNVLIHCPNCSKPTRVGFQMIKGKSKTEKIRVCKRCGKPIDRKANP